MTAVFGLGLACASLGAETWEGALAKLQAAVDAKEGRGMVVEVVRVDARQIRLRVEARGTTFHAASVRSHVQGKAGLPVLSMEGREMTALQGATLLEPGTEALEVALAGPDLAPRIVVKAPAPGQRPEVARVVAGERIVK
jgi:hypothetical protein